MGISSPFFIEVIANEQLEDRGPKEKKTYGPKLVHVKNMEGVNWGIDKIIFFRETYKKGSFEALQKIKQVNFIFKMFM